MSAAPNTQVSAQDLEQERRRIAARLEEVAKLCETNVAPGAFYGELLKRLLESLAAPAGAIWARTPQGHLQLQYQINVKEVGLDQSEDARKAHDELLRQAMMQPRPFHVPPQSSVGAQEEGKVAAGNHSNYLLMVAPIIVNQQAAGLIEIWQGANRPAQAITGYLQYMTFMAELASRYQRNQIMGQLAGQQQVWAQLEAFARQVHNSLHPTEVSYTVANEGRRLVECDRISVAVRLGSKARIEAVSGADVVERRSNLVRLMRTLCERVMHWGEKLVFSGARDDSLPPKVLSALDAYLAESNSKLLVVQPLRDDREKDKIRASRSALLMECFEPPAEPQQLLARLDVVARHSTPALYNAIEHRRIPMRMLWLPMAKVQEGIGGKAKAISALVVALLSFLGAALYLVPYQLKMESHGKLVPWARRVVYPPTTGSVEEFRVEPNDVVGEGRDLAHLFSTELAGKLHTKWTEVQNAYGDWQTALNNAKHAANPQDQINFREKALTAQHLYELQFQEFQDFARRNNASANPRDFGWFKLLAPGFTLEERSRQNLRTEWTVLNGNFREEFLGRTARPSDPILRLGAKDGPWEIELRIPQKHISQVLRAFERVGEGQPLDVDFLLKTDPTRTYRGKLYRDKIASEAIPNRDEKDEPEPEVIAFVSIDDPSIDRDYALSREALTSGTEVHAKIKCGKHRLGYALFYGVWEFFYEKVVFFF